MQRLLERLHFEGREVLFEGDLVLAVMSDQEGNSWSVLGYQGYRSAAYFLNRAFDQVLPRGSALVNIPVGAWEIYGATVIDRFAIN